MKRPFKNHFPGVATVKDRHGRLRYRLRRTVKGRRIDCYLPGPIGSTAFRRTYEAAINGEETAEPKAAIGTIAFLVEAYLGSIAFANLAASTKMGKRRRLDWIRDVIGDVRYAAMRPRHVEALMQKKNGVEAANRLKKELSQLFDYATKHYGFAGKNPAALADSIKAKSTGFHTWTIEEVETYRVAHPSGSKPRLAFELLLGTGASRQDAARMTRANIRGDRVFYRRGKTGEGVDVPIMPELAVELALLPPSQMPLLAREDGVKGYTPESLGNMFRGWCTAAGLPHCSAHGLRKAGATRLAEAGASENEIASFLGHASTREAARYTAAANRARLATTGLARLGGESGTNVSNLPKKVGQS